MNDLSFGSPWLLLLLPGVALLAALPYLWKRRMSPVGMRYADTGLVSGIGSSLRVRVMPYVPGLRFVALASLLSPSPGRSRRTRGRSYAARAWISPSRSTFRAAWASRTSTRTGSRLPRRSSPTSSWSESTTGLVSSSSRGTPSSKVRPHSTTTSFSGCWTRSISPTGCEFRTGRPSAAAWRQPPTC